MSNLRVLVLSSISFGLGAAGGAVADALNVFAANLQTGKPAAIDFHQLAIVSFAMGISTTIAHLVKSPLFSCENCKQQ